MQEYDLLQNPLIHALRTHEGQDVVMRVIAIGENTLILATAPQALVSANNHALPMI
jgi:hypothetical protein